MKLCSILLIVGFLATVATADENCKSANTKRSELKKEVLKGYNNLVIPKKLQNSTTTVTIEMILKTFTYNIPESALSVHSWLNMYWKDETIKWNPDENGNIKNLHISSDSIWHPDLSVYNGADLSGSQSVFNSVNCVVSHEGLVVCVTPTRNDAICSAQLRRFPFDVQNCTVKYGSWVHSGEALDFRMSRTAVQTDEFGGNGMWKLVKLIATKHAGNYSCCPNNTYPSLTYHFFIERHSGTYVCTFIVPALAMLAISLVSLCLSPEESSRLCVIGTNAVVHLIFVQYISWKVPISGPEPPLILVYARDSLFMSAFALVLTVTQRRLMRAKSKCPASMSQIFLKIVSNPFGRYLFMFDEVHQYVDREDTNRIGIEGEAEGLDWFKFSRILDRICFVVYFFVYLSMIIVFAL